MIVAIESGTVVVVLSRCRNRTRMLTRIVSMLTKLGRRNHEVREHTALYGSFDFDYDNDNDNE